MGCLGPSQAIQARRPPACSASWLRAGGRRATLAAHGPWRTAAAAEQPGPAGGAGCRGLRGGRARGRAWRWPAAARCRDLPQPDLLADRQLRRPLLAAQPQGPAAGRRDSGGAPGADRRRPRPGRNLACRGRGGAAAASGGGGRSAGHALRRGSRRPRTSWPPRRASARRRSMPISTPSWPKPRRGSDRRKDAALAEIQGVAAEVARAAVKRLAGIEVASARTSRRPWRGS